MENKELDLSTFYVLAKKYGRVTYEKDGKLFCITWDTKNNLPVTTEIKSKKENTITV